VVPMEEAEVVSTVAVVAVGVFTAEAAERIAAVVVACTAAARRAARLEVWVRMDAAAPAFTAAADRITGTADRVRTG
jgi:hypothetical protein